MKRLFITDEERSNAIPKNSETQQSELSRDINEEKKLIGSSNLCLKL